MPFIKSAKNQYCKIFLSFVNLFLQNLVHNTLLWFWSCKRIFYILPGTHPRVGPSLSSIVTGWNCINIIKENGNKLINVNLLVCTNISPYNKNLKEYLVLFTIYQNLWPMYIFLIYINSLLKILLYHFCLFQIWL